MKQRLVIILTSLLSFNFLGSCVATSVLEEINGTAADEIISATSKSEGLKMGSLAIKIANNAPNATLLTDSIEVCNILICNPTEGDTGKGSIKLSGNGDCALPVQTFTAWAPPALPSVNSGTYAKLHGKLLTYLEDGTPFPLYDGAMYTPLEGSIQENLTTETTVEIYDNCPLYCITDGKLEKALASIGFQISVEEWK